MSKGNYSVDTKYIDKRIAELNSTNEEVAKSLGVSRSTLYRYKTQGYTNMPLEVIYRLVELLEIKDIEEVFFQQKSTNGGSVNAFLP